MHLRSLIFFACFLVLPTFVSGGEDTDTSSQESAHEPITTIHADIPIEQLQILVKPLTKDELQVEADAWFALLRSKAREIAGIRLGVKKATAALSEHDEEAAREALVTAEQIKETANSNANAEEKEIIETAQENLEIEVAAPDEETGPAAASEEETPADELSESTETEPAGSDEAAAGEIEESATKMKNKLLAESIALKDERTAISDRLKVVLDSLEIKGGDVEEYRRYSKAVSGVELDTSDAAAAWAGLVGWVTSKEGGQRWAWNLLKFVLVLVITYFVAKVIAAIVNWLLERKVKLSQLAERLISSTIRNVFMLIGFAIALTALEIDITPIVAAIGATGLVVGLALQGTLSNFASGLMILINRPFDVGNVVTAGGVTGVVRQMNLVSTTFRTFDNQTIHVPNNEIWNNVITNITANHTRRVDLEFCIGYGDDFEQAEQIIKEVVDAHELVLNEPEPVVVTHALADSSVDIVCRPWAKTGDWWQVKTDITREVKRRFDEAGISIPYPQQDIHVYSASGNAEGFPQPSSRS